MKVVPTAIPEIKLLKPTIHRDGRGLFVESFRQDLFNQATGTNYEFIQDNHSRSSKGVLRGLHYQLSPHAQGKLVRVISGAVFDVAVDIRRSSPTFGQWVGAELSAENHHQLWIPPGFAHGFVVLSDTADLVYKTTAYYAPESDRGLLWNDPHIAIAWPQLDIAFSLSEKDQHQPAFKQAELFD
ncbi:dTDP-4-dehydrorhamnose 3,5-epimerase [Comamonas testosteroni]|uniref:dTDP-4-dehydrorhamnose 3,5-epimerase n=1 Tax=Comamonas testosteroni TaxID=285 RepID=A0A0L7MIV6_COMTE|nr:dTDP-4-dehydrorhamnose 3,5-epimerase [Comamonas testosteroni]KOC21841.1 dTDP-4-dehydrorhamnose 3,5-epimerase [Comamonas testosteroni]KWT74598.1 dTDP-4-dehydrorhamnose 3,5-epimerase [Comamonas testosteroni]